LRPIHEIFDGVAERVEKGCDLLAERVAPFGVTAEGTTRQSAAGPIIGEYEMDLHPAINLKLRRQVELLAEWVWYWRTSVRDGLYGVPGNLEKYGHNVLTNC
jgi:DNA-binding ferritin-like protein